MFALAMATAHALELGNGYSHDIVSYNKNAIYDQDYDNDGYAFEDGDEEHRLQKRSPLILLPKVLLLKKLLKINKISPVPIG